MTEKKQPPPLPVVLELAPLPREQVGPFLLLGLDKDADRDTIEAHWAQRIKWARQKQIKVPLEDINWAREILSDPERRLLAAVSTLNVDTAAGVLAELERKYTQASGQATGGQPIDQETDLSTYSPDVEVPGVEEVRAAIVVPEIPREFPVVRELLKQAVDQPLDPWAVEGQNTRSEERHQS
jgi:hypothetical protein